MRCSPNTVQSDSAKGKQVPKALPPQGNASACVHVHDMVPQGDSREGEHAYNVAWRLNPNARDCVLETLPLRAI